MIQINDLSKIFRSGKKDVIALNEISLEIPENQFVLIKGHSGCGKSTLLFSMGGMLMPSSGDVRVLDKELYRLKEKERAAFRSANIGFVFQSYHLLPYLNVMENILFSQRVKKGINQEEARQIAGELNLEERLTHKPTELSVGEKQRVALARAIITKPRLILADEPTGNLDPKNAKEVLSHLYNYYKEGGTVIMVTHGEEADEMASMTIHLEKGKISNINMY